MGERVVVGVMVYIYGGLVGVGVYLCLNTGLEDV